MGLDLSISEGLSAQKMSRRLRRYLQEPNKLFRRVKDKHGSLKLSQRAAAYHPGRGVYRSSYKNALRLTATETNMAYRAADYERWQHLDFVVGFEVKLSSNHPEPDICDDLKGRYPKTFKFVGWHPFCRCHVEPILKTEKELEEDTQKILHDEETDTESVNEVKDVPSGFTKWIGDNIERVKTATSIPYFIRDNVGEYVPEEFIAAYGTLRVSTTSVNLPSLKSAPFHLKSLIDVTNKEIKTMISNFAKENPSLFIGGLNSVTISGTKNRDAFMWNTRYYSNADGRYDKSKGNIIGLSPRDFKVGKDVYSPVYEIRGAMKAIANGAKLTFMQEYSLESIWHEIRHASAVGWADIRKKTDVLTDSMEVVNQFCARMSYPSFVRSIGGTVSHAKKVMEKGYGYGQAVHNFNTLLSEMKVSKKAAYNHFKDLIVNTPYEDIHEELIRFVVGKGKYKRAKAEELVKSLGFLPEVFRAKL